MKGRTTAIAAAVVSLATAQGAQATPAVLSDVMTVNGSIVGTITEPEGSPVFFPCSTRFCTIGSVALREPGSTVISDLLVSTLIPGQDAVQLTFTSDAEGGQPLTGGEGAVIFDETNQPLDVTQYFTAPGQTTITSITIQSDVDSVPVPEPGSAMLVVSGLLALGGAGALTKRRRKFARATER